MWFRELRLGRTIAHCLGQKDPHTSARVKTYPDGSYELMVASRRAFMPEGWEDRIRSIAAGEEEERVRDPPADPGANVARAVRRAKTQVRDMALCTPFKYFVTLTTDPAKVDRYDDVAILRKLRYWLDNHVRRDGLTYIVVPERHKDGAVHFHGFFNAALPAVDSGTMTADSWKRPRRPRSKAQRAEWEAAGARPVYNLPAWTLGFSTAIELYGDYRAAVGYVCKYIGKSMGGETPAKIGGRWYYSGGLLRLPNMVYTDLFDRTDVEALRATPGANVWTFEAPDGGVTFWCARVPAPEQPPELEVIRYAERLHIPGGVGPRAGGTDG